MEQKDFLQENISTTRFDYEKIKFEKLNAPQKRKHTHVPRYLIVVIWGLFITFVVYSYSLITLNEMDQQSKSLDQVVIPTKVPVTIEFLPNEPEPQFAPMPSL